MAPTGTGSIAVRVLSVGSNPEDHLALSKVLTGQEPPYSLDCRFEVVIAEDVDGALRALKDARIPIVLCDRELGKRHLEDATAGLAQLEDPPFLIVGSRSHKYAPLFYQDNP